MEVLEETIEEPIAVTEPVAVEELHAIMVKGKPFVMPNDLYIPPDALEVFLDAFTGPLDLLLYLIRKQNVDILNIPISEITTQYVTYVELMKGLKLELAADYLVMAAMLAEIKSRMLLPRQDTGEDGVDIDPRAELVRRLQEYERIKMAAENLTLLPRVGREVVLCAQVSMQEQEPKVAIPQVDLQEIVSAFMDVLKRSELLSTHKIHKDALSVRERMGAILDRLRYDKYVAFPLFFNLEEGRMGVVVTFLALLELLKEHLIDYVQAEPFGPIYLKALDYETDEESISEAH